MTSMRMVSRAGGQTFAVGAHVWATVVWGAGQQAATS